MKNSMEAGGTSPQDSVPIAESGIAARSAPELSKVRDHSASAAPTRDVFGMLGLFIVIAPLLSQIAISSPAALFALGSAVLGLGSVLAWRHITGVRPARAQAMHSGRRRGF